MNYSGKLLALTVEYIVGISLLLWSQIIYGTVQRLFHTKIVRFYGAWPAAGRIVRFFVSFLDIVRCLV